MSLIRADAARPPLRPGSVQAVVTSPPYLRQRVYGESPLEGGKEQTLDEYVRWIVGVLEAVRPAMDRRAPLWLNLGDKANDSGGAGGDWARKDPDADLRIRQQRDQGPGKFYDEAFEAGSYLDVPGAVVRALLEAGWRLRLPIVWDKGRDSPESLHHVGRPRWSHEMIFLLFPQPRRRKGRHADKMRFYPSQLRDAAGRPITGSVWRFPPGGSGPAHLAPFPDELARRCVMASTLPGDLVLDPFDGSGTTRRVAQGLGRRAVGLDLYAGIDTSQDQWTAARDWTGLAAHRDATRAAAREASA